MGEGCSTKRSSSKIKFRFAGGDGDIIDYIMKAFYEIIEAILQNPSEVKYL